MSTTLTTYEGFAKPDIGTEENNWGVLLNTIFDQADARLGGINAQSVAGSSNVILTSTTARYPIQIYSGTLTGDVEVVVPDNARVYNVYNNTAGTFALTVKTDAGSGVTVPQGGRAILMCDGTDVMRAIDASGGEFVDPAVDNIFTGVNTYTAKQVWSKGADVASAGTTTLGTDGNYFDVTGTETISAIASAGVGSWMKLHFDAAATLVHGTADLVLPGAGNIVTAAGDEAEFVEYASGDWRCTSYRPAAVVLNTLNGQYKFPAVQNPSADANTLDDYEEAEFPVEPALSFSSGNTGLTFTTQAGEYTKIGDLVFFSIILTVATIGSASGNCSITGLPFTVRAASGRSKPCSIWANGMNSGANNALSALAIQNTTTIFPYRYASGVSTQLTAGNFANGSALILNGFYKV